MKTRYVCAALATGVVLFGATILAGKAAESPIDVAKMTDKEVDVAVARLRGQGPAGLEKALAAYTDWRSAEASESDSASLDAKWRRAIDLVAQQKDADVSKLYWHTEWATAAEESQRTGKPLLRLFMMGRLTDNLSCANSRFFRVALYANDQISTALRENYVLCWTSVRPVPTIKVDFGDGRTLERTVTGNSIHYVVDSDGRLIDALPGLVGPSDFGAWLETARVKYAQSRGYEGEARDSFLRSEHERTYSQLVTNWKAALEAAGVAPQPMPPTAAPAASVSDAAWGAPTAPVSALVPDAVEAAPLAVSKSFVELPLAREIVDSPAPSSPPSLLTPPSVPTAADAGPRAPAKYKVEAALVENVVEAPTALDAVPRALSKGRVEQPLVAQVVGPPTPLAPPTEPDGKITPTALEAAPIAKSKRRVEQPLVEQVVGSPSTTAPTSEPPAIEPATIQLPPQAIAALLVAPSKSAVEVPLVAVVTASREEVPALTAASTDEVWDRMAAKFRDVCKLDASSRRLMDRLHADPATSPDATCPSSTVDSFENSMALDTAKNQFLHRRAIFEWLLDDGQPAEVVAFNDRVYDELFLTPASDPWVGLVPQGVFTGIQGEGLFGDG